MLQRWPVEWRENDHVTLRGRMVSLMEWRNGHVTEEVSLMVSYGGGAWSCYRGGLTLMEGKWSCYMSWSV